MVKKIYIGLVAIVVLGILAWYLVAPAFTTIEVNEPFPEVKDSLEEMDETTRAEFDKQVSEAGTIEMIEEMPSGVNVVSQGDFKPRAHEVEGKALLIEQNGKKILRFEDFDTINGPNLHIYLSSELGVGDSIDLGRIKATKGSVNYEIPEGIDTDKYNKVLVWCVPFRVLFSYAEI